MTVHQGRTGYSSGYYIRNAWNVSRYPKPAWSTSRPPSSASSRSSISTTDHYSHWCDSKSCSSRISSGNLKDNVLGNLEVPNLYTTVTPKSFLPPSPLRAKQFVMPLKLHQLEPQKKPTAPTSDLTVTFVHRKMSDSSSNSKVSCHRSGATSKQSKSSANSSKQTSKHTDTTTQAHSQAGYPDPLEHAPMAFISRLAEMTSHQADTVRFERNKRGKGRTRIS
ncbi:hypothetical protein ACHWQZ_G017873 [Mnemiopsis leidyi]